MFKSKQRGVERNSQLRTTGGLTQRRQATHEQNPHVGDEQAEAIKQQHARNQKHATIKNTPINIELAATAATPATIAKQTQQTISDTQEAARNRE
eukprot:5802960-Alexandrium_andersonii.AAC.1